MTRPLRLAARALLAVTTLASGGCTENNLSVFIDAFLKLSQDNGCKVSLDQQEGDPEGWVDTALMDAYSATGFIASPRIRNNMISTAGTGGIERNVILPKSFEIQLRAAAGNTLPSMPAGLGDKYSVELAIPAIDPGGQAVVNFELVPKGTLLAAAAALGTPKWDGVLMADVSVTYEHAGSIAHSGVRSMRIHIAPNSLSVLPIGTPCPPAGISADNIKKACVIGQNEVVTCCVQGNRALCGGDVPVASTGSNSDGGP